MLLVSMSAFEHIELEDREGGLIARLSGRAVLDDKDTTMQVIVNAVRTRKPRSVLVDLRGIPGPITFMDRFRMGELAGQYLSGCTLATLLDEQQHDPTRIGLLVARNRGADIEFFTNEAEAYAWMRAQGRAAEPGEPPAV
jgi:hypothetical protein